MQPYHADIPDLWHYCAKPFDLQLDYPYQIFSMSEYTKPAGLWVTPHQDDDWPSWAQAESYVNERFVWRYPVYLQPGANILQLNKGWDLEEFTQQYGSVKDSFTGRPIIQWEQVASQYDGILITPYQWAHRMSLNWYYGWDCASGCFWNVNKLRFGTPEQSGLTIQQELENEVD